MLAARNNLAVPFDGDAFSNQIKRLHKLAEGERGRKATGFAVNDQFNHNFYPGMSLSIMLDSNPKGASPLDGNLYHAGVV